MILNFLKKQLIITACTIQVFALAGFAGTDGTAKPEKNTSTETAINNVNTENIGDNSNINSNDSELDSSNLVQSDKNEGTERPSASKVEELFGYIDSIGENMFVLNKATIEELPDGGQISVIETAEELKELIQISYSDETLITLRTIEDMGEKCRDEEGAISDIEKDKSVSVKGIWDGDTFLASEITVNIYL